jgi:hypothetical protein
LTIAKYEVRGPAGSLKTRTWKLGATFKRHVTEEQTCCHLH